METQGIRDLSNPQIDFLILADRAEAINGKLYVMGGAWDRTYVQDFAQPVLISFALSVLVPWNATNRPHVVTVTLEDIDRRETIPFQLQAQFVAGRPPIMGEGETQRVILALPTVPLVLPGPGAYQAVARLSSGDEKRVQFRAEAVAAAPMLPGSGAAP